MQCFVKLLSTLRVNKKSIGLWPEYFKNFTGFLPCRQAARLVTSCVMSHQCAHRQTDLHSFHACTLTKGIHTTLTHKNAHEKNTNTRKHTDKPANTLTFACTPIVQTHRTCINVHTHAHIHALLFIHSFTNMHMHTYMLTHGDCMQM